METYLSVAVEVAREAGALLAQAFDRPKEISYKGKANLVTQTDKRSEALIIERLHAHFPKHSVVAEEGGGQKTPSEYTWYVDPLDGTTNFAHGFPAFCVSLGLACRGEMIAGVVYDPVRGELFAAERGAGAYLDHRRLRVSAVASVSESLLATGFPPFASNNDLNIELFSRFSRVSHGIRRPGSAALDLCSVASGRFDGFWELKLNSWDKAAGALIVTEAGGRVGDLGGGPFSLEVDEVLATNGLVHDEMCQIFQEALGTRAEDALQGA